MKPKLLFYVCHSYPYAALEISEARDPGIIRASAPILDAEDQKLLVKQLIGTAAELLRFTDTEICDKLNDINKDL